MNKICSEAHTCQIFVLTLKRSQCMYCEAIMKFENGVLLEVGKSDIIGGAFTMPKGVLSIDPGAFDNCGPIDLIVVYSDLDENKRKKEFDRIKLLLPEKFKEMLEIHEPMNIQSLLDLGNIAREASPKKIASSQDETLLFFRNNLQKLMQPFRMGEFKDAFENKNISKLKELLNNSSTSPLCKIMLRNLGIIENAIEAVKRSNIEEAKKGLLIADLYTLITAEVLGRLYYFPPYKNKENIEFSPFNAVVCLIATNNYTLNEKPVITTNSNGIEINHYDELFKLDDPYQFVSAISKCIDYGFTGIVKNSNTTLQARIETSSPFIKEILEINDLIPNHPVSQKVKNIIATYGSIKDAPTRRAQFIEDRLSREFLCETDEESNKNHGNYHKKEEKMKINDSDITVITYSPYPFNLKNKPSLYYALQDTVISYQKGDDKVEISIPAAASDEGNRTRVITVSVNNKPFLIEQDVKDILDMNKTFDIPDINLLVNIVNTSFPSKNNPIAITPFVCSNQANTFDKTAELYMKEHKPEEVIKPFIHEMIKLKNHPTTRELLIPHLTIGGPHHWNLCLLIIDKDNNSRLLYIEEGNLDELTFQRYYLKDYVALQKTINTILKETGYKEIEKIEYCQSRQFSHEGCGIALSLNMENILKGIYPTVIYDTNMSTYPDEQARKQNSDRVTIVQDAVRRVDLAFKILARNNIVAQKSKDSESPDDFKKFEKNYKLVCSAIGTHPIALKSKARELFFETETEKKQDTNNTIPIPKITGPAK